MLPDTAGRFASETAGRPVFYWALPMPPPPGSGRVVADDRGGPAGRVGRARPSPIPGGRSMDPQAKSNSPESAALQLWTIREAMAADADRALGRVRAAGFSAVELAPLPPGLTPGRLAEGLARHGLAVVSIHGDLPTPANIGPWAELARRVPVLEDHLARLAARPAIRFARRAAGTWSRPATGRGPSPGIAGSNSACTTTGGSSSRSRGSARSGCSTSRSHPDIFWQLDVYWARTGGADPAAVVAELGPRIGSLHLKDGPAVHGEPMTALGRRRARSAADTPGPDASGRLGHRARRVRHRPTGGRTGEPRVSRVPAGRSPIASAAVSSRSTRSP